MLDNMTPDGVRRLLVRKGQSVTLVRAVLNQAALDSEIVVYARAANLCVVTHDRGMATRCRDAGVRYLLLRTSEAEAEERLTLAWDQVEAYLLGTALGVVVTRTDVRREPGGAP